MGSMQGRTVFLFPCSRSTCRSLSASWDCRLGREDRVVKSENSESHQTLCSQTFLDPVTHHLTSSSISSC